MADQSAQATRSSSGSTQGRASPRDRRQNPQQQLSQIEKSVTHLLVATKQLLETLTQWSRGSATENEVSDVYVRLGYEFNIACRAFSAIGVDTSDLGPVPDLLRTILEETLSQEASQANLERFLPRIRDIIINLLHGLKRKQQRLRQKNSQEGGPARPSETRLGSHASSSTLVGDSTDTQQLSRALPTPARGPTEAAYQDGTNIPPRTTSMQSGRNSPTKSTTPTLDGVGPSAPSIVQPDHAHSNSNSSVSSAILHNLPASYSDAHQLTEPPNQGVGPSPFYKQPPSMREPKHQDALAALQRGGELERRASRRFSAYQIQKHLGAASSGIPMIPKAQHSPIPDRGGPPSDSSVSMKAQNVMRHNRERSNGSRAMADSSPGRPSRLRDQVSEHIGPATTTAEQPPVPSTEGSPIIKTPDDKIRQTYFNTKDVDKRVSSMDFVKSIGAPAFALPVNSEDTNPPGSEDPFIPGLNSPKRDQTANGEGASHFSTIPPASNEPLVLFLQYKTKMKKFVLTEGTQELSIPRLQLAFIEKFAWNTHSNGVDLPEIYLQDPTSGVRYELEDLNDIKNNSVLVLNVDALDEVKRLVDDGMEGLRRAVDGVKTIIEDQHATLQKVSESQQEATKEVARISAAPIIQQTSRNALSSNTRPLSAGSASKIAEVEALRRELAVLRQTYSTHLASMDTSMTNLRAKAATVKAAAVNVAVPSFEGESGRSYVNASKKTLNEDSERIINRVDDLQDVVEDLRKDVVTRGVRPRPQQLETVSKDISLATADLKKLQEFLRREKLIWTKVGENELKAVCDDQNILTMQEDLAADLEDDLEKAAQTFALVEEATKQQNLTNAPSSGSRSTSRTLNAVNPDLDPRQAKDGVLGEVRALQPNHETRLEAIERAERARQLDLESRGEGSFKKELGSFVEAGRLKRSGGVEEAERLRKSKDDRARKENWERVNGVTPMPASGSEVKQEPVEDVAASEVTSPVEAHVASPVGAVAALKEEPGPSVRDALATGQDDNETSGPATPSPTEHMPGAFTSYGDETQDPKPLNEGTAAESSMVTTSKEQAITVNEGVWNPS